MEDNQPLPARVPVLIAGGGPVGLALAALLAEYGVASLTVEADEGYCTGSRAICMSRRSQEILGWVGADKPLVDKGLSWTGGRSYFRDEEILHFHMPHDPTQRYAPMVNIQQYYVEEYAHDALRARQALGQVAWKSRVTGIRQDETGATVSVQSDAGTQEVRADWVVACDGGRSTVRELLGLALQGTQYEGRYVIVDIEQESSRPTERLAWFDPPSNPGSTLLMHRQPENVWRIDYQIRDDEDPEEAVKPENVLPRVQSHLEMIGEDKPWKPLWISIYNAKCLTLDSYRHGRVLFAGDAAHLVPIFGVRGLNSGLDDAANLAWKLAWVIRGGHDDRLLDSYSVERVYAARQNIGYGAKSTEFMAPPDFGFRLMRDAALRLSLTDDTVRSLVNPRQSAPISYEGSPLNLRDDAPECGGQSAPGQPAADVRLLEGETLRYLSQYFGKGFVVMAFGDDAAALAPVLALRREAAGGLPGVQVLAIGTQPGAALRDADGQAYALYGASPGTVYLLRPDGYVMGRWSGYETEAVRRALSVFHPDSATQE